MKDFIGLIFIVIFIGGMVYLFNRVINEQEQASMEIQAWMLECVKTDSPANCEARLRWNLP